MGFYRLYKTAGYGRLLANLGLLVSGPGTSPTPFSTTQAFLFAPLVYVDPRPQDPSGKYNARGMTLISITAPSSGPVATRQVELGIAGTEVGFGGFATLLGSASTDKKSEERRERNEPDVYLLGMATGGLQIARVGLNKIESFDEYEHFNPKDGGKFSSKAPSLDLDDETQIYLPGTFSSGNVFYSPYFSTFIMIYFNKLVDSTFYIRYLNLDAPIGIDKIWITGGKNGQGIEAEDVEGLVRYSWSPQQTLYISSPGPGGYNYAGMAHPEYFNRQYFPKSLYPKGTPIDKRQNDWYGSGLISEAEAGGDDGKFLLLSWTSQLGGDSDSDSGIYQVQLAMLEFDEIPAGPDGTTTTTRPPSQKESSATSILNKNSGSTFFRLIFSIIVALLYIACIEGCLLF